VAGPDGGGVGQLEQHLGQAVVQLRGAAGLEVGAATAVDQQRVAGEDMLAPHKTHAARGVARRVQGADCSAPKVSVIAIRQLHRGSADAAALPVRRFWHPSQLCQLAGAGDVVGMGVGFQRPDQLQAVFAQHLQVTLQLGVHRVDDDRLAAGWVKQHIGVGAGSGVKQLDRCHGVWCPGWRWMCSPRRAHSCNVNRNPRVGPRGNAWGDHVKIAD
jgi:hypothetical protein